MTKFMTFTFRGLGDSAGHSGIWRDTQKMIFGIFQVELHDILHFLGTQETPQNYLEPQKVDFSHYTYISIEYFFMKIIDLRERKKKRNKERESEIGQENEERKKKMLLKKALLRPKSIFE
jgi:hypothetical protein